MLPRKMTQLAGHLDLIQANIVKGVCQECESECWSMILTVTADLPGRYVNERVTRVPHLSESMACRVALKCMSEWAGLSERREQAQWTREHALQIPGVLG